MQHELSPEETRYIAGYSYSVGVEWYDVELEIVDHIAAWVEEEMNTNHLSFDEAYEKMKAAFPKQDLLQIVQSKKKSVERKVSRLIEKEIIGFFSFPKISLTILLLALAIYLPSVMSVAKVSGLAGCLILVYLPLVSSSQKRINEIRGLKRCELLSMKVKSRYEIIGQVLLGIVFLLNFIRIFWFENIDFAHAAPMTNLMRSILVFFVLTGVFEWSVITVRKNVLNTIVHDYPYAFSE